MNMLLKVLALIISLHFSCSTTSYSQDGSDTRIEKVSKLHFECRGEKRIIHVPKGYAKPKYHWYEEGYYLVLSYPDNSYISILCGGNAVLDLPRKRKKDLHYRLESIQGCCPIIYGGVTSENLLVFDQAFDALNSAK